MEKQLRAIYLDGEKYINAKDVQDILNHLTEITHRRVVYSNDNPSIELEHLAEELKQTKEELKFLKLANREI